MGGRSMDPDCGAAAHDGAFKATEATRYSPGERSRETLSRLFPSGATDRGDFRLSSVRFAVAVFSNRVGRRSNPGIV
jgi:hypothetical protein